MKSGHAAPVAEADRDITYVFYDGEEVEAERNGLLRLTRQHPDWLVGDFAVLVHSGFARSRALLYNVTVGLATLAGALAGYFALASMQQALQTYRATNEGKLPPDKAGVVALLAGPPRFQCEGGDFDYDPTSGSMRLTITDPNRC